MLYYCEDWTESYPNVTPLSTNPSLLEVGEVGTAKPKCDVGNQTLSKCLLQLSDSLYIQTYGDDLDVGVYGLLPDDHEAVGEVEHEEDQSSGGGSNVGSVGVNLYYFYVNVIFTDI